MDIEKRWKWPGWNLSAWGGGGVKSTYYVLLSSDFYNIFSRKNTTYLKEIISLGHTIGVHFDEVKYHSDSNLVREMENEIKTLESCLGGYKVTTISMHRPSKKTLNADYVIQGGQIINSYSTEFFEKFKYISDSRKNWRENLEEM